MNRLTAAALLSDTHLRRIFEGVVEAGSVRAEDLGGRAGRLDTRLALHQLRTSGLIEESDGIFSPSAKGRGDHDALHAFEQKLEAF